MLEGTRVAELEGAAEDSDELVITLGRRLEVLLRLRDEDGRSAVELACWAVESEGRMQRRARSTTSNGRQRDIGGRLWSLQVIRELLSELIEEAGLQVALGSGPPYRVRTKLWCIISHGQKGQERLRFDALKPCVRRRWLPSYRDLSQRRTSAHVRMRAFICLFHLH